MSAFDLNPELEITEEEERLSLYTANKKRYVPYELRHPSFYVVCFLPKNCELLSMVGYFMDYRPLFCYVSSPYFEEEYMRSLLLQERPLAEHRVLVCNEFTRRWKHTISYAYSVAEYRAELGQLLFFLTRVKYPNRHFDSMILLKTHPDSAFYDRDFSVKYRSLDQTVFFKQYPGYQRYKFFTFEQSDIVSTATLQSTPIV